MTAQTELGTALLIANEENRKLRAEVEEWKDETNYYAAESRKLRAALERAGKLFDAIAMRDQNGHALDGANEIRAALANEQEGK